MLGIIFGFIILGFIAFLFNYIIVAIATFFQGLGNLVRELPAMFSECLPIIIIIGLIIAIIYALIT